MSQTVQSLSHDAAGRLTAITGASPTGSWSYDGRGNLTSTTSNGTTTSYSYITSNPEEVVSTSISGQPTTYYAYDQWSMPLTVSESVPQQLRYAGYWYDNELGWYWLSVRSYDSVLERFLQPDPSELEGLFSYVYASDNPSDLGDPSGLSVAIPLQSGTLVTPGPGSFFENHVAVGSDQWNLEISNGTKSAGGLVGANGRPWCPWHAVPTPRCARKIKSRFAPR
ncbi:MAG TPA: RHS repeat-associated core domain-containing protein [Chloroflexota bacterium]|nr:RHS repeat-associated core domain-containing protein [Chloroflexota bacterium]